MKIRVVGGIVGRDVWHCGRVYIEMALTVVGEIKG